MAWRSWLSTCIALVMCPPMRVVVLAQFLFLRWVIVCVRGCVYPPHFSRNGRLRMFMRKT